MATTFHIEAFGTTDVGHLRQHNEDEFGCYPELGLFVVADGMGGHSSGDIASRCVVAAARDLFQETAGRPDAELPFPRERAKSYQENRLVAAGQLGNQRLREMLAGNHMYGGQGSTYAAVSVVDGRAQVAHVGDSRVYLLRGGTLEALTRDHSLINEYMLHMPNLTPEEMENIPKNIITRAIGMGDKVVVDSRSLPLDGGDVLMISSDGVHGLVPDPQIQAILIEHPTPKRAAEELIAAALKNGGSDNATVIVMRVTAVDSP
jgi:serine/threonine protein phosphatase PrpC